MSTTDILSYFKNLDFTHLDPLSISTISTEIQPALFQIILHNELSHKLEILFQKSPLEQNFTLLKKIDIEIIKRKIGSRFIEKIIDFLNFNGFIFLCESIEKNILEFFLDDNATFVIRKILKVLNYLSLLENEKNYERIKKFKRNEQKKNLKKIVDSRKFNTKKIYDNKEIFDNKEVFENKEIHINYNKNFKGGFCKKKVERLNKTFFNYKIIKKHINTILNSNARLFTMQEFINGLEKKQKITKKIIKEFDVEDLKSMKSRFYEFLISVSSSKNKNRFLKKIENEIMNLATDKHANYVIKELCKSIRIYIIEDNLTNFNQNSNVIFNLVIFLIKEDPKKANKIIKSFYLKENSLFDLILKNDSIDSKFTKLIEQLFFTDLKYNLNVNSEFRKKFSLLFINDKNGRILIRAFLNGKAEKENKEDFVTTNKRYWKELAMDKWGIETLNCFVKYAKNDDQRQLNDIIRKGKSKLERY